jgi:nucleotide-binding universal stress UspA family protein
MTVQDSMHRIVVASDGSAQEEVTGRIVVGIDGSASSVVALQWAANQASLTGVGLDVILTWEWPTSYGDGSYIPPEYDPGADANTILEEALVKIRGDYPEVKMRPIVVEGHPAPTLVRASDGADLLVVGSRGRGEFAGMLLGSASEYCVHHALCPWVVDTPGPTDTSVTPIDLAIPNPKV